MKLSDTSVRRPVFAAVIAILMLLVGIVGFLSLPVREYPDTEPPIVSVGTTYTGAAATVVESRVTQVLENSLAGIEGIQTITSRSRDGQSDITIEFAPGRSVDSAANDVRDRVGGAADDLPEEVLPPEVRKVDADASPILFLVVSKPGWSRLELSDYVDRNLVDRFSSIDGVEIDARLFDLLTSEARVMPHVHLSLQAGDNMILKRMKRRHSRELAIDLVARLKAKRPDIAIGADIIAGFPTEDDAMFANSVDLVRQCGIVHGHIFPYSSKKGTPAARMPQLPPQIIKTRAKALRDAVATEKAAWISALIGSIQNVAVESGGLAGHAENFAYLKLNKMMPEGRIVSVRVTHIQDEVLQAEVIE